MVAPTAPNTGEGKVEAEGSGDKGYPQLHSKFEASLGYCDSASSKQRKIYLIIYCAKYHQGVFICAFELFLLAYSNLDVHTTRMLLINIFSQ